MLRPEWFTVSPAEGPAPDADGLALEAEVGASSYLGAFARVWVDVEGLAEPLVVEVDVTHRDQLERGTRLRLQVPHDRAVLVDEA